MRGSVLAAAGFALALTFPLFSPTALADDCISSGLPDKATIDRAADLIFSGPATAQPNAPGLTLWPADLTIRIVGLATIDEAKKTLEAITPTLDQAGKIMDKKMHMGVLVVPPANVDVSVLATSDILILVVDALRSDALQRYKDVIPSFLAPGQTIDSFLAQHQITDTTFSVSTELANAEGIVARYLIVLRGGAPETTNLRIVQLAAEAIFAQPSAETFTQVALEDSGGTLALNDFGRQVLAMMYSPCMKPGFKKSAFLQALGQ
jgi:hypothetical protein